MVYVGAVEAKAERVRDRLAALGATVEFRQDVVEPGLRANRIIYGGCHKDLVIQLREALLDLARLSLKESVDECPPVIMVYVLS